VAGVLLTPELNHRHPRPAHRDPQADTQTLGDHRQGPHGHGSELAEVGTVLGLGARPVGGAPAIRRDGHRQPDHPVHGNPQHNRAACILAGGVAGHPPYPTLFWRGRRGERGLWRGGRCRRAGRSSGCCW